MECIRTKGYYTSIKESINNTYGTFIYSITLLKKSNLKYSIHTMRGILVSNRIKTFLDNIDKEYENIIIDYIVYVDCWGIVDKHIIKNYKEMLKYINIKYYPENFTSDIITDYNRKMGIEELRFLKIMINKTREMSLIYINTDITNLYGI